MKKIKKGDIVARKSYGKDIIFYVKRIVKTQKEDIAILCGLIERIEADSTIEDLEIINQNVAKENIRKYDERIEENRRILNQEQKRIKHKIVTGKILHLDAVSGIVENKKNRKKKCLSTILNCKVNYINVLETGKICNILINVIE